MDKGHVIFYGLFLDRQSRDKLKALVPDSAAEVFCDHLTLAHESQFNPIIFRACGMEVGKSYDLTATHIGNLGNLIYAVKVYTECPSANDTKHITLYTMDKYVRPYKANSITNWTRLPEPIELTGTVRPYIV